MKVFIWSLFRVRKRLARDIKTLHIFRYFLSISEIICQCIWTKYSHVTHESLFMQFYLVSSTKNELKIRFASSKSHVSKVFFKWVFAHVSPCRLDLSWEFLFSQSVGVFHYYLMGRLLCDGGILKKMDIFVWGHRVTYENLEFAFDHVCMSMSKVKEITFTCISCPSYPLRAQMNAADGERGKGHHCFHTCLCALKFFLPFCPTIDKKPFDPPLTSVWRKEKRRRSQERRALFF